MTMRTARLIDGDGRLVGTAEVHEQEGLFAGTIDLSAMPVNMRQTFSRFEDIVNQQMFGLLDAVEEQIDRFSIKATWNNGCAVPIEDLQIFPSTQRVSFRVAEAPASNSSPWR